jgi:Tfp pilus assembly protein FimT
MSEKGTSLTELIVVLGIVALATAISAHYLLGIVPRTQRQSATAEFAVELRTAHRTAIATRKPIRAAFDTSVGRLRLELSDDATAVLRQYDFRRRGIGSVTLSRGTSVLFYPNGRVASPVTITLMTLRGETSKITVSITGKVTWS